MESVRESSSEIIEERQARVGWCPTRQDPIMTVRERETYRMFLNLGDEFYVDVHLEYNENKKRLRNTKLSVKKCIASALLMPLEILSM
jgi:hypothetical protein